MRVRDLVCRLQRFSAVGGEWFAMWQSQIWNGQQAAFRIFVSILLVSIFIGQQDCELL